MANKHIFHKEYSLLPATGVRARQLGEKYYFTGKPCKRGHLSPRYASSGNCSQCIADSRGQAFIRMKGRSSKRSEENHEAALSALKSGLTTYISGSECPKGHRERYITSNNCVECSRQSLRKRAEQAKWGRIKKLYSITKDQYMKMLQKQSFLCVICRLTINDKNTHVDHCHKTGKVRGLLCSKCNQAIGLLDESEERLFAAARYISEHSYEA